MMVDAKTNESSAQFSLSFLQKFSVCRKYHIASTYQIKLLCYVIASIATFPDGRWICGMLNLTECKINF